ncbi:MAG TPA: phage envelope protein [Prolixibacteraceae bacterium]|nr:phage envelope protein [Prolixibacteraceae bacterium]
MFTLEQIHEAHAKVKSGADFPGYVQDLIGLGILSCDIFVADGHAEYCGEGGYEVKSAANYAAKTVADASDIEKFRHYLKIHQQGETDYFMFCNHAAETGVEKWTVDHQKMTCIYFDRAGTVMLVEKIPE